MDEFGFVRYITSKAVSIVVEPAIIITNNELVVKKASARFRTVFVDGGIEDVLRKVRDSIHRGHVLLTHPLSGSIKPNETPYKTVLISETNGETIDIDSLRIIEQSIGSVDKFLHDVPTPEWPERIADDFRLIDYDLVRDLIS